MKEPHQHIADTFRGKTGSAYQTFSRRSPTAWQVFSTAVTVCVFLILLLALPWGGRPW